MQAAPNCAHNSTCGLVLSFHGWWWDADWSGSWYLIGGIYHPGGEIRGRVGGGGETIDTLPLHGGSCTRLSGLLVTAVQLLNELVHDWKNRKNSLYICKSLSLPSSLPIPFSVIYRTTYMHTCSCVHTHTHTHTRARTCTRTHTHTHTHTHTDTHKLTLRSPEQLMGDNLLSILSVGLLRHACRGHVLPVAALCVTHILLPPKTTITVAIVYLANGQGSRLAIS